MPVVDTLFNQVSQTQVYWDVWMVGATAALGVLFSINLKSLRYPIVFVILGLWIGFSITNDNGLAKNQERRQLLVDWALSEIEVESCHAARKDKQAAVAAICSAAPGSRVLPWRIAGSVFVGIAILVIPLVRRRRTSAEDREASDDA